MSYLPGVLVDSAGVLRGLTALPETTEYLTVTPAGQLGHAPVTDPVWGAITGDIADQTDLTTAINDAISTVLDGAPGLLDTLNELAAAIGDDPNFATTVLAGLDGKLSLSGGTMTGNIRLAAGVALEYNGGTASLLFNGGNIYSTGVSYLGDSVAAGVGTATNGGAVGGLLMGSSRAVQWSSDGTWYGTKDLFLLRGGPNTLAIRNGSNSQKIWLFNTWTNDDNYERLTIDVSSSYFRLKPESLGTGATKYLWLDSGIVRIPAGSGSASLESYAQGVRLQAAGGVYFHSGAYSPWFERNQVTGASDPYRFLQTWNNAATAFSAFVISVTDTASATGSFLLDLQVGGARKATVTKLGTHQAFGYKFSTYGYDSSLYSPELRSGSLAQGIEIRSSSGTSYGFIGTGLGNSNGATIGTFSDSSYGLWMGASGRIVWGTQPAAGSIELALYEDAANVLAQRNGVNSQAFRLYNTYTDANNYEHLQFSWVSNEARIGTRSAGTGTLRYLALGHWDAAGTWTKRIDIGNAWVTLSADDGSGIFAVRGDSYDALLFNGSRLGFETGTSGVGDIYIGRYAANVLGVYASRTGVGSTLASLTAANATLSGSLIFTTMEGVTSSNFTRISGSNQPTRGIAIRDGQVNFASNVSLYWSASLDPTANANGISLVTDGTSRFWQRSGTTAQAYYLSNTYTNDSNYERGFARWNLNVFEVGAEAAGTGSARALAFVTNGTTRVTITTAGTLDCTGVIQTTNHVQCSSGAEFRWGNTASKVKCPSDGIVTLLNSFENSFNRLQFGGTTSSYPALKRNTTNLEARLADDSDYTTVVAASFAANGTNSPRTYALGDSTNARGLEFFTGGGRLYYREGSNAVCSFGIYTGFLLSAGSPLGWCPTSPDGAADLILQRDDPYTLALRLGTNPNTLRVYNTYTDSSNYERGFARWNTNVFQVGTEYAGTGANRSVVLTAGTPYPTSITLDGTQTVTVLGLNIPMVVSGYGNQVLQVDRNSIGVTGINGIRIGVGTQTTSGIGFCSTSSNTTPDLAILRDAAHVLAQRHGTNPQAFRLYNTWTDASNYERGFIRWNTNVFEIGTEAAGTGSVRDMSILCAGYTFKLTTRYGQEITTSNAGIGITRGWLALGPNASYACRIQALNTRASIQPSGNFHTTANLWLLGMLGGAYVASLGRHHGTGVSVWCGYGATPADVNANGGNAGNFDIWLNSGGAGAGTGVAGSNSKVRVFDDDTDSVTFEITKTGNVTAATYAGYERSSDPSDPSEGNFVLWMSDGTGSGDDGDLLVKITAGSTTTTAVLMPKRGTFDTTEYDFAGTYAYYGGEYANGDWTIFRVTVADGTKVAASEANNVTYTDLATAWTDRVSLTYA